MIGKVWNLSLSLVNNARFDLIPFLYLLKIQELLKIAHCPYEELSYFFKIKLLTSSSFSSLWAKLFSYVSSPFHTVAHTCTHAHLSKVLRSPFSIYISHLCHLPPRLSASGSQTVSVRAVFTGGGTSSSHIPIFKWQGHDVVVLAAS